MSPPVGSLLWRSLRSQIIYGANTDVGKTIFTTLLCRVAKKTWSENNVSFLKPISTGPLEDSDERHVQQYAQGVAATTLFQFQDPVSPHVAARGSSNLPNDFTILQQCWKHASAVAAQDRPGWLFLETAGGVHSPGPQGTTQADMFMSLRPPVILVGDSRLGGISQTITSFESLKMRGYDVEALLLFRNPEHENVEYLADYFAGREPNMLVKSIPMPPVRDTVQGSDEAAMTRYYDQCSNEALGVLKHLDVKHTERINRLESMAQKAHDCLWLPFTQQSLLPPEKITVIDSAREDYFHTLQTASPTSSSPSKASLLQPAFDGSASWWTQGLGHANPQLTLAASYAAGRYGHVMFAEAVHEPALALAEQLLGNVVRNPRLRRVFYSDNGSTAVEVALKMALRAARLRYGWAVGTQLEIIGLKNGYHGDTTGAMDCAEPCVYNQKVDWYEGKGFWFDYPTVMLSNGRWMLHIPEELRVYMDASDAEEFQSLDDLFNVDSRLHSRLSRAYRSFIADTLRDLQKQGRKFGALILEPIVLGAGGMALVDPLFQGTLVDVVRQSSHLFQDQASTSHEQGGELDWSGLPIIFDEVFTGLYRLGRPTSGSFLGTFPDISVHAKLLTGGLLPLSTTLASDSIFNAFISNDKSDALLHGHSYTAHAVGCQVAIESLKELSSMDAKGEWNWAKYPKSHNNNHVIAGSTASQTPEPSTNSSKIWSMWSTQLLHDLSMETDQVAGSWAIGTVLAIHLRDDSGKGYTSNSAARVRDALGRGRTDDSGLGWNVHCRVLGNVLYVMASLKTTQATIKQLEDLLRTIIISRS